MDWLGLLGVGLSAASIDDWQPSANVESAMEAIASVINFLVWIVQGCFAIVVLAIWWMWEHPWIVGGAVACFAISGIITESRRSTGR